jgi:hypothetical protein
MHCVGHRSLDGTRKKFDDQMIPMERGSGNRLVFRTSETVSDVTNGRNGSSRPRGATMDENFFFCLR